MEFYFSSETHLSVHSTLAGCCLAFLFWATPRNQARILRPDLLITPDDAHSSFSYNTEGEIIFYRERKNYYVLSLEMSSRWGESQVPHTTEWEKKNKLFGLSGLTFEDDFLFLLYLEKYEDETLIYLNKCHAKILLSILACALVVIWCVLHHCFFFLFFFFSLVLFFFFSVCFSYLNAIS